MRFNSVKHPELRLHLGDESVKFHAGVAEVTNPDVIEQLHRYEHLGIEPGDEDETAPAPDDDPEDEGSSEGEAPQGNAGGEEDSTPAPDDGDPDLNAMDEAQLRAFAEEEGIDLGKLQKVEKIRERIAAEFTA